MCRLAEIAAYTTFPKPFNFLSHLQNQDCKNTGVRESGGASGSIPIPYGPSSVHGAVQLPDLILASICQSFPVTLNSTVFYNSKRAIVRNKPKCCTYNCFFTF